MTSRSGYHERVHASPARLALSALLAMLMAHWDGQTSVIATRFLPTLGMLVLIGGWMAGKTEHPDGKTGFALLLLVSAIGVRLWSQRDAELMLLHMYAPEASQRIPALLAASMDGVGGHLLGAAVALWVLRLHSHAVPFALSGIAVLLSGWAFEQTRHAMLTQQWHRAVWMSQLGCWTPLVVIAAMWCIQGSLRSKGLWVLLICGALTVSIAPSKRFWSVFVPAQSTDLPTAEMGPGVPGDAFVWTEDWSAAFHDADYRAFPRGNDQRWCAPVPEDWTHRLRLGARLLLPAHLEMQSLHELFAALRLYHVENIFIEGQAERRAGQVGRILSRPVATLHLDPPPDNVARGQLLASGDVLWGASVFDGRCVLRPDSRVTVQQLHATAHRLTHSNGPCKLALGLDIRDLISPCPVASSVNE